MNITRKDLPDCEIEFTVTTDASDTKIAQTLALELLGRDINIPGFRPGKAPVNEIRKRVGEYRLFQETLEQLVEGAYRKILQDEKIFPLIQPQIKINNEEALMKGEGNPEFVFVVTVRPEPELPDYKSLGVTYEEPTITPEDTQKALDELFATWKERTKEEGTKIETATTLEEANDKATSHKKQAPLANTKDKPDDEWAITLGAENLDDLTQRLQANLTLERFYISGNKFTQEVLNALKEKTNLSLPKKLIQHDLEHQEKHKTEELEKMGLDLEGYSKKQQTTVEELKKQWKDDLEHEYTIEFITAKIAELENISVSDEEVKAEIDASKEPNAKQLFNDPDRKEHLRYLMRRDKVIRQLVEWNMPKNEISK